MAPATAFRWRAAPLLRSLAKNPESLREINCDRPLHGTTYGRRFVEFLSRTGTICHRRPDPFIEDPSELFGEE